VKLTSEGKTVIVCSEYPAKAHFMRHMGDATFEEVSVADVVEGNYDAAVEAALDEARKHLEWTIEHSKNTYRLYHRCESWLSRGFQGPTFTPEQVAFFETVGSRVNRGKDRPVYKSVIINAVLKWCGKKQLTPEELCDQNTVEFPMNTRVVVKSPMGDYNATVVEVVEKGYRVKKLGEGKTTIIVKNSLRRGEVEPPKVDPLPESLAAYFDDPTRVLEVVELTTRLPLPTDPPPRAQGRGPDFVIQCPSCDGLVYAFTFGDTFKCEKCEQVITRVDSEPAVIPSTEAFLKRATPKKNAICTGVKPCCANCGSFHFDSSSNGGKRSSGFCRITSDCVVAGNWCPQHFPMSPHTFRQQLKNQTTNLGFSLKHFGGAMNKGRPPHLVYTEDDHKATKKMCEELATKYELAYHEFVKKLKEKKR